MSAFADFAAPQAGPLAKYTLESLLDGAARLRPEALAISENGRFKPTSFANLAERVEQLAGLIEDCGLNGGETVVLIATPSLAVVAGLLALCRLGLHIALAPLHIPIAELVAQSQALGVAAVLVGADFGGCDPSDLALHCAARAQSIRFVGVLEGHVADGAVDLAVRGNARPLRTSAIPSHIITFEQHSNAWLPIVHTQSTLIAGALAMIDAAQISQATPLLMTLAPCTYAGLAAGPLAMLLSGACLHYNGPFSSSVLLDQCASFAPLLLVAPTGILTPLAEAGLLTKAQWCGVLALSRWQADAANFSPPHAVDAALPITDLHAFGERLALAQGRDEKGRATAIFATQRAIIISGHTIVVANARVAASGAMHFEGAAVSTPTNRAVLHGP